MMCSLWSGQVLLSTIFNWVMTTTSSAAVVLIFRDFSCHVSTSSLCLLLFHAGYSWMSLPAYFRNSPLISIDDDVISVEQRSGRLPDTSGVNENEELQGSRHGPYVPHGSSSEPLWTAWLLVRTPMDHMAPHQGPYGPHGSLSGPLWTTWLLVRPPMDRIAPRQALMDHMAPCQGPFGPHGSSSGPLWTAWLLVRPLWTTWLNSCYAPMNHMTPRQGLSGLHGSSLGPLWTAWLLIRAPMDRMAPRQAPMDNMA